MTYESLIPGSEGRPVGLSFVVPARNEAGTVASVVEACLHAGDVLDVRSEVLVVDDCSTDSTAERAAGAGAQVLTREGQASKAHALNLGVTAARGTYLCFADADCVGLEGRHLAELASLVVDGDHSMAVGIFDYRVASRIVQRFPWSAGERVIHRSLFPSNDERLSGYNVEALINEAVGRSGGTTASLVMDGVCQRTKRDKLGLRSGLEATVSMWRAVSGGAGQIDHEAYRRYMDRVVLVERDGSETRQHRLAIGIGFRALVGASRILGTST
jgi:glycosyltransferase involved in cell wall biosynthesis